MNEIVKKEAINYIYYVLLIYRGQKRVYAIIRKR
jgi:hypothetical protein